jgi:hypothetical protein
MESKLCQENLAFWLQVEQFKNEEDDAKLLPLATEIYESFVKVNSPNEVNVDSDMRKRVDRIMLEQDNINRETFNECQVRVLQFIWIFH